LRSRSTVGLFRRRWFTPATAGVDALASPEG